MSDAPSPSSDASSPDAASPDSASGPAADATETSAEEAPAEEAPVDEGRASDALDAAAESLRRVEVGDEGDDPSNGLARLVLSLVQLLHDVLEKQAIRRMESGTLSEDEIERIGLTLKRQADTIDELCDAFNIDPSDLDLPLGTIRHVDDGE